MRDQILIDIAMSQPESHSDLEKIEGLPESTIRRAGDRLLSIIAEATHDQTNYRPPTRPSERQKSILKKMQQVVTACAEDLGIPAEIVAPKKELSAAMMRGTESRVFRGWRQDIVGNDLRKLLNDS